jgi:hypothetical protein
MFKEEVLNCPIEDLKNRKIYNSKLPLNLPQNFEWNHVSIDEDLSKIIEFLNTYFSNGKFSKIYTNEHIKLLLGKNNIILTITNKNIIYGVIGGCIKNITISDKTENFVEVKFICAHPKIRSKNISYVLIDELIRRFVNLDYSVGYYLSNKEIENSTCKIETYERIINMENTNKANYTNTSAKLFDFSGKTETTEMKFNPEQFKVIDKLDDRYVLITDKDIEEIYKLYLRYISCFTFSIKLTLDEFKYYFGCSDVVKTYKIMKDGVIIDFVSVILQKICSENKNILSTCTLTMYSSLTEPTSRIIYNSIKIANEWNCDIIYVHNIMYTGEVLLARSVVGNDSGVFEFKFLRSPDETTKYLQLFNWKSPRLINKQISLF